MNSLNERETRRYAAEQCLIENIAAARNDLFRLLEEVNDHWGYEDGIYRFYHQSFKVFFLQASTEKIVTTLQKLLPEQSLNDWFLCIVREGTGKKFSPEINSRWLQETRPVVEAFLHAKYFLEMICRYTDTVKEPQQVLPSGWASVLYLSGLR